MLGGKAAELLDVEPVDRRMARESGENRFDAEFQSYQRQRREEELARTGGKRPFSFKPPRRVQTQANANPATRSSPRGWDYAG